MQEQNCDMWYRSSKQTIIITSSLLCFLALVNQFPSMQEIEKRNHVAAIGYHMGLRPKESSIFGDSINSRVLQLDQFNPDIAIFHERKHDSPEIIVIPQQLDDIPQKIVRSFVDNSKHILAECSATSQFHIDTRVIPWNIQTIDFRGIPKKYGGDELYITYKDQNNDRLSPNAVARVVDLANGQYALYFLKSHSPLLDEVNLRGRGSLTVELIHTCGASHLEPPLKQDWKPKRGFQESGFIGTKYIVEVAEPPIGHLKMEPSRYPELSSYDVVIPYGDSVMNCFFGMNEGDDNDTFSERRSNVLKTHKSFAPLNSDTIDLNDRDTTHNKWLQMISTYAEQMKAIGKREENSAFFIGSCAWDISAHHTKQSLGDNNHYFSYYDIGDHLNAVRTLIETLRQKYPKWKIYWQSCSAVHRQSATEHTAWGSWYSNNVRGRHLYIAQQSLMRELGVPVVDMYEITYEFAELYDDHVHCGAECTLYLIEHFFPSNAKM